MRITLTPLLSNPLHHPEPHPTPPQPGPYCTLSFFTGNGGGVGGWEDKDPQVDGEFKSQMREKVCLIFKCALLCESIKNGFSSASISRWCLATALWHMTLDDAIHQHYWTHLSLYSCDWKKKSMKPFVVSEGAACKSDKLFQWHHLSLLHQFLFLI